jgi:hypothetical protein
MIPIVTVLLIVLNLIPGQVSVTGRRLILFRSPAMNGVRFVAIGMGLALLISSRWADHPDWYQYTVIGLLLLCAARKSAKASTVSSGPIQNTK